MMMVSIIIAGIVLMVLCILVLLIVMRKKNTPRADGSMPKLGDADLFSLNPLQSKSTQKQAKPRSKSTPEEDLFKIPDSTF